MSFLTVLDNLLLTPAARREKGGYVAEMSSGYKSPQTPTGEEDAPDYSGLAKTTKAHETILANEYGFDPDLLRSKSLGELRSLHQAAQVRQGLKEWQAKMDEHQARMDNFKAQTAQRLQQAGDDAAEGVAVNRFATGSPAAMAQLAGPLADPGQLTPSTLNPQLLESLGQSQTPQARLSYALQTPGLGGRNLSKVIDSLSKIQGLQAGSPDAAPKGTTINGIPLVYSPKGGQFEFDPAYAAKLKLDNAQNIQAGKPANIPPTFDSLLDKTTGEIADAQNILNMADGDFAKGRDPMAARSAAKRNLAAAQQRGKAAVDRYHSRGLLSDDQRDDYYSSLGLDGNANPAPAPLPKAATTRINVIRPDGKVVSIPAGQKAEAIARGYKLQ